MPGIIKITIWGFTGKKDRHFKDINRADFPFILSYSSHIFSQVVIKFRADGLNTSYSPPPNIPASVCLLSYTLFYNFWVVLINCLNMMVLKIQVCFNLPFSNGESWKPQGKIQKGFWWLRESHSVFVRTWLINDTTYIWAKMHERMHLKCLNLVHIGMGVTTLL